MGNLKFTIDDTCVKCGACAEDCPVQLCQLALLGACGNNYLILAKVRNIVSSRCSSA